MKTSDFYYDLPQELIAQTPIEKRDTSRLMTLDRVSGATGHHHFYDLPDYLNPGDCLILNNSRVLPARLVGQRLPGGGICEVLLLNDRGDKVWECLVRPGRKLRKGTRLSFGNGELTAEIVEQLEEGGRLIRFDYEGIFLETLERLGKVPLGLTSIITLAVTVLSMLVLTFLVQKTKLGKAMRAVSEDMDAARLMGINVNSTISFTFAVGSALAAVGALLYCNAYPQISPTMGNLFGLKAFVAAVLGGIGSIPGAMIGGYLLGVAEILTKAYISSDFTDAVVFGILIVVLMVKPAGIMGKYRKEKV